MDGVRQRLADWFAQSHISMKAVSEACGKNHAYIQQFIKKGVPETLPEDVRHKLVHLTGLSHMELGAPTDLGVLQILDKNENALIKVKGDIEAGVWRELFNNDDYNLDTIELNPIPRYKHITQYALRVRGDSMNKTVKDGQLVICVPWGELGRDPRENELLVIERQRGELVEATLKRVRFSGARVELWPESDNPKWNRPIPYDDVESGEVRITGKVIGIFQPED